MNSKTAEHEGSSLSSCLAVLLVGVVVGYWIFAPAPLPELVTGLSPEFIEADTDFSKRVKDAFPEGMEEVAVRDVLEDQGFNLVGNSAVFSTDSLSCFQWKITWDLDTYKKLDIIEGHLEKTCQRSF